MSLAQVWCVQLRLLGPRPHTGGHLLLPIRLCGVPPPAGGQFCYHGVRRDL